MASASSTKGTKISVLKGSATAASLTPTAISKAAPAVVTVASVTGITAGDLVTFPATGVTGASGFSELDGKTWVVGTVTGGSNTFTLLGSDTSASTGTLAASPSISHYADSTKMVSLTGIIGTITFNGEAANTVSVATFEDPSASLPSQIVGAGTVDLAGYLDKTDAGYKELYAASVDKVSRKWRIQLGNDQGYYVFDGPLSAFNPDVPMDGGNGFTCTIALASKYRHLF